MFATVVMWVLGMFFGTNVPVIAEPIHAYDCDEYWLWDAPAPLDETAIINFAKAEFDAIYANIVVETTVITRKDNRRQIIVRQDNKFVGGKVLPEVTENKWAMTAEQAALLASLDVPEFLR